MLRPVMESRWGWQEQEKRIKVKTGIFSLKLYIDCYSHLCGCQPETEKEAEKRIRSTQRIENKKARHHVGVGHFI